MNSQEEKDALGIGKEEDILYQTNPIIISDSEVLILSYVMGIGGLSWIIYGLYSLPYVFEENPDFLFYALISIIAGLWLSIASIVSIIIIKDRKIKMLHTKYYITSKRIIIFIEKGLFLKFPKIKQIPLKNIDCIQNTENSLNICSKSLSTGKRLYYGNEDYYKKKPSKRYLKIQLRLENEEGERISVKFLNVLFELIPLKRHPYLEYVYFVLN